jgi:hypothetical protein
LPQKSQRKGELFWSQWGEDWWKTEDGEKGERREQRSDGEGRKGGF